MPDVALVAPPPTVLAAYGFSSGCRVRAVQGGLINHTFRVDEGARSIALQRLNPIFAPSVNLDIDVITTHLAHQGLLTPRLVRTTEDAPFTHDAEGSAWRALSWLEGRTLPRVEQPATARAAALLVARFHCAVADLTHTFHFSRPGAHDTAAHLARLEAALREHAQHPNYAAVLPVGRAILQHAAALEPLPAVPTRLVHGDLKITNLLFDERVERALALLDLDTMARLTIPIELGDALRSWCNPAGEDSARATFRADVFEAALDGYASGAPDLLGETEHGSLVLGAQTIALELAARFCADALYESYFGWNPQAFPSRSAHNLARAQSQLAVADSVQEQRAALEQAVRARF
jgi:aminoglycoside phosphotransferase (APT) family kinase protein